MFCLELSVCLTPFSIENSVFSSSSSFAAVVGSDLIELDQQMKI